MKKIIHRATTRGSVDAGWLKSHHSFSFSRYYDPERMGFGLLRVLNDDLVTGGMGFGTHPHDNMEIISIPLSGALRHHDSTGNGFVIRTNDVQIMSAGSGLTHSEVNNSKEEVVSFLQIWILPKKRNIVPRYEQKTFAAEQRQNKWQTVVSPNEEDQAVWINQDAFLSMTTLDEAVELNYTSKRVGNGAYLFVLEGALEVAGEQVGKRDAIGLTEYDTVQLRALHPNTQVLLIDVPMVS